MDAETSPSVQCKVVKASTKESYQGASESLRDLAELDISAKQCERITQHIGRERVAQRNAALVEYEELPWPEQRRTPSHAPANAWTGRVAAVIVDGGRAQIRDERWGTEYQPGEKRRRWWREPKAACLATFASQIHPQDPLPEVPSCLLDPLWLIPKVLEIKRTRRAEVEGEPAARNETPAALPVDEEPQHWSPPPLVRSLVATFGNYEQLGRLARVEAWQRGFDTAVRKVFLGDGHLANWSVHEARFSDYTPIADLLHALSYVYTAAVESSPDMEASWPLCVRWITAVWQGRVSQVLAELEPLLAAARSPESHEKLRTCLSFLRNNASRMQYDQYRQRGLPITTVLIESAVKQLNKRMKGTEMFWKSGAEPQLQLRADLLSETQPLDHYWKTRPLLQTGFRNRCTKP